MNGDLGRLSAGELKKILERVPDNADVVIRSNSIDSFVSCGYPWVYDNKLEAVVLIPDENHEKT